MVERLYLHCLLQRQTLLPLLRKFCHFTSHDVYKSFDISVCVTKYDAVLFYYYKWFSNLQYFYSDILNAYLHSSDGYSMTRSYSSRLYV
jgi:hypothetical protein